MNEEDFKKILEESLNPIREDVSSLRADLNDVKTDLKEVKETQSKHTDILENRLLPSVTYTENTIKAYSDMYKMNNDNMKRLEKRMEVLEDDAGVKVPEELILKELPDLPAQ